MASLILDFLRRWRWLVALYVLFTALESLCGVPLAFTPAAMICLIFDGQRGVFRSVRPMPITRRAQATAWWIIGVPLPSLLALLPAILGTAIHAHYALSRAEPWFVMTANAVVGLGWGSLCFLLATLLPTRPPNGALETVGQAIVGMCWGIMFPGSMLVIQFLPKTVAALHPWHWAVAAAVPVLFVLSFLTSSEMLRRRSSALLAGPSRKQPDPLRSEGRSITGVPFYLLTFGGRTALLLFAMAAVQILFLRFIFGHGAANQPAFSIQIIMMALIFGIVTSDMAGLRALRTLPLSTPHLALLILSVPAISGLAAGLIVTLFYPDAKSDLLPLVRLLVTTLIVAGFSSLALAVVLHIAGGIRFVVIMLLGIIPAILAQIGISYPWSLGAAGSLAGLGGFALLMRGLRRSSTFYQPKPFFGGVVGQPLGMR